MTKKFIKILFLFIFILIIYIIRNDISNFIQQKKVDLIKSVKNSNIITESSTLINDTLLNPKKVIDTPGALRVKTNVFNFSSDNYLTKTGIIFETNNERAKENLKPLTENEKLNISAQKKVNDMFDEQYFEHISPSGVGVSELGQSVDYEYIMIGENLALGNFKDDKALIQAWMNSPGHRANIMNKNYTEIGVYAMKSIFEGKKTWIAVQHFGIPQNLCPKIDSNLKNIINTDQSKLKSLQNELKTMLENVNNNTIVAGKTHEEQIIDYNLIVNEYNKLIAKSRTNIDLYNKSVREFNNCVEIKK